MIKDTRIRASLWGVLVLSIALCAPARAGGQLPPSKSGPSMQEDLVRSRNSLPDRDRAAIHPGNPLKLIGREQGDNDLRSSTPALARSNRVLAEVDEEQNHKRALAMVGEGASFTEPVLPPASTRACAATTPADSGATSGEIPASSSSGEWPWAIGIGAGALLVLWIQKRFGLAFLARGSARG